MTIRFQTLPFNELNLLDVCPYGMCIQISDTTLAALQEEVKRCMFTPGFRS